MISGLTKGKGIKTPEQVALLQDWQELIAAKTPIHEPLYLVKLDRTPYSVHASSHFDALEKAGGGLSTPRHSGSKAIICGPCRDSECSCGGKARVIEMRWV